ncbi:haloacid dehalogenase superfamily, subfamily IA, variant 3 with third motif having DD or ED [Dehalogenimonas formicexedens]|uniref:Haloacid dehalogenase superfamily, subfamily IA, variant 3 with third motif having DD or ED n=1 Tax=Dehalogenimonas formicexedens TaxID=1839801 RepID=A0A1P8F5F3_9CHLR|nr:HAD family phosphatase [Dehalogenimonas formicexedens]APV43717.1 haloacid dehalogenase superfamily, subfamily IA, variant 3 with third motif having DD or ED [Dehalogenimonas formicexedens]
MVQAIIFDLDGTLVQTEKLKAQAYAIAVQKIRNLAQPDARAIDAYKEALGSGRDVASRHVMDKLNLEKELRPLMPQYRASEPAAVLTEIRTGIYHQMIADPGVIARHRWTYTLELLRIARENRCRIALATMSHLNDTLFILRALDIDRAFDVVVTAEDVVHTKPDPEIYQVAARKLDVPPGDCLVIEDSPNGVQSATAAGMKVIAFATPFTFEGLHSKRISQILKDVMIAHHPEEIIELAHNYLINNPPNQETN